MRIASLSYPPLLCQSPNYLSTSGSARSSKTASICNFLLSLVSFVLKKSGETVPIKTNLATQRPSRNPKGTWT